MSFNPLGHCELCSGDLCMRPDRIACLDCGLPAIDHPATPKLETKATPKPSVALASSADHEASHGRQVGRRRG